MRIPSKAIPRFEGLKERISGNADNEDLRKAIMDALPTAVEQTKDLAPYFKATNERETAKKIFDFLKSRVKYKADDYRQVIQLPSAILRPGAIADCKSLSLFTAAILQNLGIPWHFVLASYNETPIPGHIYVQTDSGIIIDVVWGKFNSEKKPKYRYKMNYGEDNPVGLGAFEPIGILDKFRSAVKEKTQQFTTWVGEKKQDVAGAVKTATLAPGRALFLILVKNNLDGLASKLQKIDQGKLRNAWNKAGGNWTVLTDNIRIGASKPSRKLGFLAALRKTGINGIGAINQAAIMSIATSVGTAIGTAVPGAGTAAGAGAGASLGSVLIAIQEILPDLIKLFSAADATTGDKVTVPSGSFETVTEEADGGTSQQPKPSGGGNTALIVGGIAVAAAIIYFANKKK
jgi:hypothetical protein